MNIFFSAFGTRIYLSSVHRHISKSANQQTMKYLYLFIPLLLGSCVSHQELMNFQNGELPAAPVEITNLPASTIQADDILRISVHSFNPLAAQPFNIENTQGQASNAAANNPEILLLNGYLVDADGMINFPVLGKIQVGGLSIEAATDTIRQRLTPYLSDAVVNARFLNFRYTVLGEVNQPGTYNTYNKRMTLLEAIGRAGDLTLYANRNKVLLIRERNGQREFARLDLQSNEIFASAYFYIQQNDVIYIEPNDSRVATVQDPVFRWVSLGSAGLSLITLIVTLFTR